MLKIKCPSCSSQFKVGEEFLGKYVECGSCEYQFTVADTHVTNQPRKNHYPVIKQNDLSQFSKTFESANQGASAQSTIHEQHLSKLRQDDFMPEPLWKKAVTFLGWGLMLAGAALLALGSIRNGFLMDAGYDKRFIIGGFIALVSSICFFMGARYVKDAIPKCLLAFALLCALAYFLPKYELPTSQGGLTLNTTKKEEPKPVPSEGEYLSSLKEICRYEPVQEAIDRAHDKGDTQANSVIALWIKGAAIEQQYSIQDYFKNTLGLTNRPSYFNRKTGALLILEGVTNYTLQDVAELSDVFGPMDDLDVGLRLIAISYQSDRFPMLDTAMNSAMNDPSSSQFYSLNFNEASHFDPNRVHSALKRLEKASPRFTADGLRVFKTILKRYKDPKILNTTSKCVMNWFSDELPKHIEDFDKAANYSERGVNPDVWPEELLSLLLKAGSLEAPATALGLWDQDPTEWESVLIGSGRDFTQLVYDKTSDDRTKNLSIINIIEETRSPNSKQLLESLRTKLNDSYVVAIDGALSKY